MFKIKLLILPSRKKTNVKIEYGASMLFSKQDLVLKNNKIICDSKTK